VVLVVQLEKGLYPYLIHGNSYFDLI